MLENTKIHLYDAELKGMDAGTVVEDEHGKQLGHWPMGIDDAEERANEEYPDAKIIKHRSKRK